MNKVLGMPLLVILLIIHVCSESYCKLCQLLFCLDDQHNLLLDSVFF